MQICKAIYTDRLINISILINYANLIHYAILRHYVIDIDALFSTLPIREISK